MAFDGATGMLVLFGGLEGIYGTNGANPLSDTWSWDGNRWISVPTSSSPVARSGAAMAYDGVHRLMVLRGGVDIRGNFINEIWTWDGVRWAQMSPLQSPPVDPWIGTQPMCWDSARGAVLLFNDAGGVNGVPEDNQLWAWDGSTWTLVPAGGATPFGHGGQQSAMAFDTSRNSVVFFSDANSAPTTWTFTGSTWTQASTSGTASSRFSMVADDARSNIVLFGSNGDTWIWNGTRWTAQNPAHSPSPRTGATMAYDQVRHLVLLFGGSTGVGAGTTNLNDLWAWNGADWAQLSPSS